MRLNDVQKNFKDRITGQEKPDQNSEFSELFETGAISLENRFSVYQNNVLKSLTDVVIATYPLIESLTGIEFLRGAARLYIQDNLPEKSNLNDYGGNFSTFIEGFEPAKNLPYLPDIARMEWAMNEAYYAPDDSALNMQELQNIAEEDFEHLTFSLRHSCRFIRSNYPLYEIRDFCLEKDRVGHLNIDSGNANLLILRSELEPHILEIESGEYDLLKNIEQGKTISQSLETISSDEPNLDLGEILQKHFSLGTFSSFEIRS